MNSFCPNCEVERSVRLIKTEETHKVRDLDISLDVEYFECKECGLGFDGSECVDALEIAYREFRRIKGMVQPESVRIFRKKYGMTQHELARLLGWGLATLSRYENGALQDDAHDRALQLVLEPHNLLKLVESHPDALTVEKRETLLALLKSESTAESELLNVIESRLAQFEPSEDNGFRRFVSDKFFNAVLFFCRAEVNLTKTKLNKLLWYADLTHYRDNAVSITGARYAHCTYGPAPDWFDMLFTYMLDCSGQLRREEAGEVDYSWPVLVPQTDPDMNVFEQTELTALVQTQEFFKEYSASNIRDHSHEEKAYKSTIDGEIISYRFAQSLNM